LALNFFNLTSDSTQQDYRCTCDSTSDLIITPQPCDEDQRVKFQNDSILSALRCTQPDCSGYLREHVWKGGSKAARAAAAAAGGDASAAAAAAGDDGDDDDDDSESKVEVVASSAAAAASDQKDTSSSTPTEAEVVWVCSACPQHTLTDAQAKEIYVPCRKLYEDVKAEYMSYVRTNFTQMMF
jgi:hypothetical protein